jgi:hypothetical protein
MVPITDPYHCQWCSFSTVYKGNMKRHLISCHSCTDELLRKYNFELERLRKSSPQRATPECLPFIEIKPPQPPGTRRPRNPPSNKSLGRPKKSNSTSGNENPGKISEGHERTSAPLPEASYLMEPLPPIQYGIPPPQLMMDYGAPMGFMPPGQLVHHPNNATYIIKDCNDSGLGMDVVGDYSATDVLHQPQALPGY